MLKRMKMKKTRPTLKRKRLALSCGLYYETCRPLRRRSWPATHFTSSPSARWPSLSARSKNTRQSTSFILRFFEKLDSYSIQEWIYIILNQSTLSNFQNQLTTNNLFHWIVRGVFASAKEIYHESGVAGFFQGVVPRLTGELLALVLASTVSFTVTTYILADARYKPTVKTAAGVNESLNDYK